MATTIKPPMLSSSYKNPLDTFSNVIIVPTQDCPCLLICWFHQAPPHELTVDGMNNNDTEEIF